MKTIAFIGLGAMGSRMARHLVDAGYDVRVYNRTPSAAEPLGKLGATVTSSPREAAQGASVVITMLTDDPASRAIWLDNERGALIGAADSAILVECGTVTPAWVHELNEAAKSRGLSVLDAPVAGSRPQAEQKKLVFFVGGEVDAFEAAKPILGTMGGQLHHVGDVGSGALMKLAVNSLFASQLVALGELLGFLKRSGIAPERAMSVLGGLPITSPAVSLAGDAILAERFEPMFPVELVAKDLRYANQTAEAVSSELPITHAARTTFERAASAGHGSENINAVARLFL